MSTLPPIPDSSDGSDWPSVTERVLREAQPTIETISQGAFTPHAFKELNGSISAYIADLIDGSRRIARRHRSDVVSANHVVEAARTITPLPVRRLTRAAGVLGGMFLGAFLPELFKAVESPSNQLTVLWVLIGLIGTALVIYEQTKS
jgi:hypothetical protein